MISRPEGVTDGITKPRILILGIEYNKRIRVPKGRLYKSWGINFTVASIDYLLKEAVKLPNSESIFNASSDIIESVFGCYKFRKTKKISSWGYGLYADSSINNKNERFRKRDRYKF